MHPVVLAITGASGAIYAVRLLEVLLKVGRTVYLSISPAGKAVLETELGINVDLERFSQGTLTTALSQRERETSETAFKVSCFR
jgi:4-hydroxy-3-polyprenylbenzoate decarboxylase